MPDQWERYRNAEQLSDAELSRPPAGAPPEVRDAIAAERARRASGGQRDDSGVPETREPTPEEAARRRLTDPRGLSDEELLRAAQENAPATRDQLAREFRRRGLPIPSREERTDILARADANRGREGMRSASEQRYQDLLTALEGERSYWEKERGRKHESVAARQIMKATASLSRNVLGSATGGTYGGGASQLRALREGLFSSERLFGQASEQAAIARIQEENARQALAGQMIAETYRAGTAATGAWDQANVAYGNLQLGNDQLAQQQKQFDADLAFAREQYRAARSDKDRNFWISVVNGIVQTSLRVVGAAVGGPAGAVAGDVAGKALGGAFGQSGRDPTTGLASGGGRAYDPYAGSTYAGAPLQGPAPVTYQDTGGFVSEGPSEPSDITSWPATRGGG